MSETLHKIFGPDGHIPEETMMRYAAGQLNATEQHKVERHALSCEICSDVMEGLMAVRNKAKIPLIIDHIKKEVHLKTSPAPVKVVRMTTRTWVSMAAGITLVLGLGYFFMQQENDLKAPVTSEEIQKTKEPSGGVTDETGKDVSKADVPEEIPKKETLRSNTGPITTTTTTTTTTTHLSKEAPLSSGNGDVDGDKSVVLNEPKAEQYKLLEKDTKAEDLENAPIENVIQEGETELDDVEIISKNDKTSKEQQNYSKGKKNNQKKKSRSVAFDSKQDAPEKKKSESKPDANVPTDPPPSPNMVITAPQEDNKVVVNGNSTNSQSNSGYTQTVTDSVSLTSTTVNMDELSSRYQKGKQFLSEGKWDAAIAEFKEVIKDPKHVSYEDARLDLATAYLKKGDKSAAKKLLEEISKGTGKNKVKAEEELKKL